MMAAVEKIQGLIEHEIYHLGYEPYVNCKTIAIIDGWDCFITMSFYEEHVAASGRENPEDHIFEYSDPGFLSRLILHIKEQIDLGKQLQAEDKKRDLSAP